MWGLVSQLPVRVLGLGVRLWGLYLHVLSLGLWALLFFPQVLLWVLYVCVQEAGRVVLTAAHSASLAVHVCSVYVFLQGLAWAAQLVGRWVALHMQLCRALLETLRLSPLLPLCAQVAQRLLQVGVWAGRGLSRVRTVVVFVQMCAYTFFLDVYLCMHLCFAAISSKVRVQVHVPFQVSLPFQFYAPLSLGVKVRQRPSRAKVGGTPQGQIQGQQKPQMSRSPEPTRRREVPLSRSELSPGGKWRGCSFPLDRPPVYLLGSQAGLGACFSPEDTVGHSLLLHPGGCPSVLSPVGSGHLFPKLSGPWGRKIPVLAL
ncbi:uncharacterized protein LOC119543297 [Choloepus didactylus]|uniref:uncharacterized protein LOC119543297 n=1 Tax=Choloepus didactylus TaxID=27675 RepID=UPI0018A0A09E|nr:uncharacterized protein LOC119543297 [Choloepus didactylus]